MRYWKVSAHPKIAVQILEEPDHAFVNWAETKEIDTEQVGEQFHGNNSTKKLHEYE